MLMTLRCHPGHTECMGDKAPNQTYPPEKTMTYSSNQDFHTELARSLGTWLRFGELFPYTQSRTQLNYDRNEFARHLHAAMGWKKSTVDDWA